MATTKVDFKRELRQFYAAKRSPAVVDVPELTFLMIDGRGDPNTTPAYREAVSALFSVSYAARFALKRAGTIDFAVMPLEGLWWASDMSAFSIEDKSAWQWTMLIMQPDAYSAEGPTIASLHAFIAEQGRELAGKHHEIYLGDPRRSAPEKLKTIIRQPVR